MDRVLELSDLVIDMDRQMRGMSAEMCRRGREILDRVLEGME